MSDKNDMPEQLFDMAKVCIFGPGIEGIKAIQNNDEDEMYKFKKERTAALPRLVGISLVLLTAALVVFLKFPEIKWYFKAAVVWLTILIVQVTLIQAVAPLIVKFQRKDISWNEI